MVTGSCGNSPAAIASSSAVLSALIGRYCVTCNRCLRRPVSPLVCTPNSARRSHYDRTYDLNDLQSVDFIVVPFSDMPGGAHTFLSFGFGGRDYLAVSVEIRKERGEEYKPLTGILRQFEITNA